MGTWQGKLPTMPPLYYRVGINGYRLLKIEQEKEVLAHVSYRPKGRLQCPRCEGRRLVSKGFYLRRARHLEVFGRDSHLLIRCRRLRCLDCKRTFLPALPGLLPGRQSTEPFRQRIARDHHEGICGRALARLSRLSCATVERIYAQFNRRKAAERETLRCPQVLGIDEHTLHKGQRFATTFCDLRNHKIFDVVPGKSGKDLCAFLSRLEGREKVRVVCIDLSSSYRSLVEKWFPNARIVADRFHVVRLIQYHFLTLCRQIVPSLKHKGLSLRLLQTKPDNLQPHQRAALEKLFALHRALKPLYEEMHRLRLLMNQKHRTKRQCRPLATRFWRLLERLQRSGFPLLQTLAKTLSEWAEPIACMWRFTKNNGITEGFHRKMKLIQRRAYGFRNFQNYRLRVIAHCG
jgi:transposase